ncbi:type IV secretion system DNA-binding domain-containing protein [Candidatus Nomurabacteria bacterium]|nr:type IV secretion system DNA-binding domain-containing protein [Candidatus Nomurabacteria bacterium]
MYFGDNKDITYLAKTNFRNKEQIFGIKTKDRRQHMYVLGKSGTGKSALLYNMIIQNIANGSGVCVVDPHGELVEDVLKSIPDHRLDDVIYFNPADITSHMGFNVLEIEDPKYKHLVASGLMGIFTKIWANAWSARMEYILNNSILALLDTPGTTLLGIPRILVDKDYRQKIIENLKDPVVRAFWVHEYEAWQDKFRNEAIAPIQNKVGQFLSTAIIRNVVGQSNSTINIFDIMNEEKVFLVNVSKGRIGEDNSALLGGMLITKIQLAAMERVRIPEKDRKDFYLYVDEFQNFVTDSFASILSEARKYRLCLTIAHQYTGQLITDAGPAVRDAVFGNVGTMIIFRVGADDADFLEKEFSPEFTVEDIVNQPNYHVYMKLMVDGVTSRPFSAWTLPPYESENGEVNREKIIKRSKELYTRPREVVEKEINEWSGMTNNDEDGKDGKWKAVCSNCGVDITLPFMPKEGRSVYCKDCMAKIKKGDLMPVQNFKTNPKKEAESYEALANLGIEFSSSNNKNSNRRDGNKKVEDINTQRRKVSKRKNNGDDKTKKVDLGKILAEALKVSPNKKDIPQVEEVKEIKTEKDEEGYVSLSDLKGNTEEVVNKDDEVKKEPKQESTKEEKDKKDWKFASKDQSEESKNSLKEALMSMKKNVADVSLDSEVEDDKDEGKPVETKSVKQLKEDIALDEDLDNIQKPSNKSRKEVPEDVLKDLLK